VNGRVLVAGVGNVFLGDDGFGVEVARRLADRPLPDGVQVADIGIRGVHLAFELLDGVDLLVLADAAARGETPGTVSVLDITEPSRPGRADGADWLMDAHDMTPDAVLGLLGALGGRVGRAVLVACEPADLTARIGLSAPVEAAVDEAVGAIERIVRTKRRDHDNTKESTPC
jgi:hydrogenase maturation protease